MISPSEFITFIITATMVNIIVKCYVYIYTHGGIYSEEVRSATLFFLLRAGVFCLIEV